MQEIDMEKIMAEIRAEIKNRDGGGDFAPPEFKEIKIKSPEEIRASKFEPTILKNALRTVNALWRANVNAALPGNVATRFVKRLLRKFVRAAFYHAIVTQEDFNKNVVTVLNQLNAHICELESQISSERRILKSENALEGTV